MPDADPPEAAVPVRHALQARRLHADEDDDTHRVFIKAVRNIRAGEELNYDYGLVIDERYTPKLKAQYQCLCGAKRCRGTMLAPKRGSGR